jgi:hypothetical protein
MSASGRYQSAASNVGFIYLSSDYGSTLTQSSSLSLAWNGIAVSATGQYQNAAANTATTGTIYVSSNYGSTWTSKESQRNWRGTAVSASGKYQAACVSDSNMYVSIDYGNTWTARATTAGWRTVSISASGQYMVACRAGNPTANLILSIDYGFTWTFVAPLAAWRAVAISSSGQYITGSGGNGTYTCYNSVYSQGVVSIGGYTSGQGITGARGSLYYDDVIGGASGLQIADGSTWRNVKSFVIDHPIDTSKYLVHSCLEGPEAGVYYRGEGKIINNEFVVIQLPDYVKNLALFLTVEITPIYDGNEDKQPLSVSRVVDNQFTVYGENGEFFWTVFGKRENIQVEPSKKSVTVMGQGPYKWI